MTADIGTLNIGRGRALNMLRAYIEEVAISNARKLVILGHPRSTVNMDIFSAAEWVATTGCGLSHIDCARIGVGLSTLPKAPGFAYSLVIWYYPQEPDLVSYVESDNKPLSLRHMIGDDSYSNARVVQFLVADGSSEQERHRQPQTSERSAPAEPELQTQLTD